MARGSPEEAAAHVARSVWVALGAGTFLLVVCQLFGVQILQASGGSAHLQSLPDLGSRQDRPSTIAEPVCRRWPGTRRWLPLHSPIYSGGRPLPPCCWSNSCAWGPFGGSATPSELPTPFFPLLCFEAPLFVCNP